MTILVEAKDWAVALEEKDNPAVLVLARVENAFVRNAAKKLLINEENPATNTNVQNVERQ